MAKIKIIGLAVLLLVLLTPIFRYRQAAAADVPVFMLGRSVMAGWFGHWGWSGADEDPVSFHGYTLYHRSVDGPEGDGSNMVDSVRDIVADLPVGEKILFFKFCFVDFVGGSAAEAEENFSRNTSVVQQVYDLARGEGITLIVGNALPQVSSDTDSYLVDNHRRYNAWLEDMAADQAGSFHVFDQYGVLADSSGRLKAAYATDASDSHPNSSGYTALDATYQDFLEENFPVEVTPPTPFVEEPGDVPATGSESDHPYTEDANKIITTPAFGCQSHVRAFSPRGVPLASTNFFAYSQSFRGGARLALGDVDRDGQPEIITGAGTGGGPQVRVFERDGTLKGIQFFAFAKSFHGGVDVAAGDFDGDGKDEIGVCQLSGGQAWAKVYRYDNSRTVLFERNVFGSAETGCTMAFGDLDKDHRAELIVGQGSGSARVQAFDFDPSTKLGHQKGLSFSAFPGSTAGVDVETADFDRDGKDEIIVSQLSGSTRVKVVRYNDSFSRLSEFYAFPANYAIGVNVTAADITGDRVPEILVGPAQRGGLQVRVFSLSGRALSSLPNGFFAYAPNVRGGVEAAAGRW